MYLKSDSSSHNYLSEQFSDVKEILKLVEQVVKNNDFTLGRAVDEFEDRFAKAHNAKYAVGVGSGTDAIFLSLKALGLKPGDEVITTPFTFFATVGAIATTGAKPVFVDVELDGYNIDVNLVSEAITPRTRAIVPVHWAGRICDMKYLRQLVGNCDIAIVEDACHAVGATRDNEFAGSYGDTACFSFHPLKNLNVWGDGGIVLTNSEVISSKLKLLRNHGLINRNECVEFAFNSRLDTVQAVIANHLFDRLPRITTSRQKNAHYLDRGLTNVQAITLPSRHNSIKEVFHLYSFLCERRDELQKYLHGCGIDAKIHYPVPMHLQPASKSLNHKLGDFPNAENISAKVLSLPVHEFISKEQLDFMIEKIKEFYGE
jgi:dTDP-3-amino-2,3,6-trideoxy-4-keto-D-glucose/dTDP-3-amino-3,4,6-trideoxy-alpha-D-glucose/dTDP-2,6-dideoxy-D-kanosamine transaminase